MDVDGLVRQALESAATGFGLQLVFDEGHVDIGFTRVQASRDFVQVPVIWYQLDEDHLGLLARFHSPGGGARAAKPSGNVMLPSRYVLSDLRPFVEDVSEAVAAASEALDRKLDVPR